jgi:hypothetical protein
MLKSTRSCVRLLQSFVEKFCVSEFGPENIRFLVDPPGRNIFDF